MASIFCAWRSCASRARRSVTFCARKSVAVRPSNRVGCWCNSTSIMVPSWRRCRLIIRPSGVVTPPGSSSPASRASGGSASISSRDQPYWASVASLTARKRCVAGSCTHIAWGLASNSRRHCRSEAARAVASSSTRSAMRLNADAKTPISSAAGSGCAGTRTWWVPVAITSTASVRARIGITMRCENAHAASTPIRITTIAISAIWRRSVRAGPRTAPSGNSIRMYHGLASTRVARPRRRPAPSRAYQVGCVAAVTFGGGPDTTRSWSVQIPLGEPRNNSASDPINAAVDWRAWGLGRRRRQVTT